MVIDYLMNSTVEAAAKGWKFLHLERPYTQFVMAKQGMPVKARIWTRFYRRKFIVFLILLIVPAVNLSSMTHSRMVRRREEIGVRRAFGQSARDYCQSVLREPYYYHCLRLDRIVDEPDMRFVLWRFDF